MRWKMRLLNFFVKYLYIILVVFKNGFLEWINNFFLEKSGRKVCELRNEGLPLHPLSRTK